MGGGGKAEREVNCVAALEDIVFVKHEGEQRVSSDYERA